MGEGRVSSDQCVEAASDAISVFFSAEQAEQREVNYIFPATELFSLMGIEYLNSFLTLTTIL